MKEYDLKIVSSKYKEIEDTDCVIIEDEFDLNLEIKSDSETQNENNDKLGKKIPISLENLKSELTEFVNTKLSSCSIMSLDGLVRLEKEVWMKSHQIEFSFIDFLAQNKEIFSQRGLNFDLLFNEKNQWIEQFVNQQRSQISDHLKQLETSEQSDIEDQINEYYGVKNFSELNIGTLDQVKNASTNSNRFIIYANSLITKSLKTQTEQGQLLLRLAECPLLGNVRDFLNWPGKIDDLKETLVKECEETHLNNDIRFIETYPGVLLKLTSNTDIDSLKRCIEVGDYVNACGHLVSLLAVKYLTINKAPRALISNEIQSSLMKLLATQSEIYSFIGECIIRLPASLVPQLIFDFLISPAVLIENDREFSRKMFQHLSQIWSSEKLLQLSKIGEICSINEWSLDFIQKPSVNVTKNVEILNLKPILETKNEIKEETLIPLKEIIETENDFDNENSKYEHVMEIRKKYGVGLELDEGTKVVTDSLKGVIGRSLESLSNELYNKDMHFVLELIQNADDNSYSKNQCPTLVFVLDNSSVTLFNNELGFSKKNLSAICDVKASTKGKHQKGYIGRKGIGFKSVFTVTDRPEIHSNGFHLKFDLNNGHIGYILPDWISQLDHLDNLKRYDIV